MKGKNLHSSKEETHLRNTKAFIEATQALIEADNFSLKNLSIRKIADKAGFHNSTIYLYFNDLDQLIKLASIKNFYEYSQELEQHSKKSDSPEGVFMAVWQYFCKTAFKKPEIYYHFFFGKYSEDISGFMKEYYELFPLEKAEYSTEIEAMYYGENIEERCMKIMVPLLHRDNQLTTDNMQLINEMVVSYLKYLLEKKCADPDLNNELLTMKLKNMLRYAIGLEE